MPADCPDGVRHSGGVSLAQASMRNTGTGRPSAAAGGVAGCEREIRKWQIHKRLSTDAGHRGGRARSSDEARQRGRSEGARSRGRIQVGNHVKWEDPEGDAKAAGEDLVGSRVARAG